MEEIKKVQGGTMVVCMECGKVFYGNMQRQFCNACLKEKASARSKAYCAKKRERLKTEREAEKKNGTMWASSPTVCRYLSPEQRFKISAETGRIYAFVREVEEYNRLHGTKLSYGQYENMLFLEREKRKREKNSAKIGAILQSQEASPEEVEKAYDSLEKRGRK